MMSNFALSLGVKRSMIKLYFKLLILMLFPSLLLAKPIDVIIYVDDAYPPYSFIEGTKAKGIYIDILNAAFSTMPGFSVNLEPIPWQRGKEMMALGKGFALVPPYFHGHDWPYLYPYSMPFYVENVVVACTNAAAKTHREQWPNDYRGLVIGNVSGYDGWGGKAFDDMVKANSIELHELQSSETLIRMLHKNRLDCIMIENGALSYLLQKNQLSKDNIKITARIGDDAVYIGYSAIAINNKKYPYSTAFQKAFDSAIYRMKKTGEIQRIMKTYRP
jgi:polar amino acid transport system substrate-binding protein